ncbi:MAG: outer membrane beta-barrel protein [Acidobacteria bacterium]|nr:outer membrane beta-barrel protein [Acidobacteriota bacterium]
MVKWFAAIVLCAVSAATASAQSAELGLTVGRSVLNSSGIGSLTSFEAGTTPAGLGDGVRIGARWVTNSWVFLGHEFSYAYQRSSLKIGDQPARGMTVQNMYYNFVAHATPEGTVVRPFATAGVGVSVFFPPGASSLSGGGDNKFGYNYGGGLKFKLTDKFGLRFDVRDHVTGKPFKLPDASGRLHNVEYSSTFSLLF